jgi:hypothetical protein
VKSLQYFEIYGDVIVIEWFLGFRWIDDAGQKADGSVPIPRITVILN